MENVKGAADAEFLVASPLQTEIRFRQESRLAPSRLRGDRGLIFNSGLWSFCQLLPHVESLVEVGHVSECLRHSAAPCASGIVRTSPPPPRRRRAHSTGK